MMVLFGEGEENGVMVEKRQAQLVLICIPDRKADRVKEGGRRGKGYIEF